MRDEVSATIRDLKPSSHLLLFYDSDDLKREILYDYIADGLDKGRGIIYVCSEEEPDEVRRGLASWKIDVEPNERSGNILIKRCNEWYLEEGRVEPLRIVNRWREAQESFAKRGLGLRAAGEVSCFFKEGKIRDLLRYEYALRKFLSIPMEAICAYDIRTIVETGYTDMIMPLVRAHGKAIFSSRNGSVVIEPEDVEEDDVEKLLRIDI